MGSYCDMQRQLTGSQRKARERWKERMKRHPNEAENLGKALKAVRKEAEANARISPQGRGADAQMK